VDAMIDFMNNEKFTITLADAMIDFINDEKLTQHS
jgi:hypothetical protein